MEITPELDNELIDVFSGIQISENTDNLTQEDIESELLDILRRNIDWQRFHNLSLSIGKQLNDHQLRFMKATILERAIANYSNDELTYVGNLENGCDFIVKKLKNLRIEMKYVEGCIFSTKTLLVKKFASEIKLMNSNGPNKHLELPHSYADYLLICDLNGAGLISKEELKKYIIIQGDGIKAKQIPIDKLHILFKASDIKEKKVNCLKIKEGIIQFYDNIINSI